MVAEQNQLNAPRKSRQNGVMCNTLGKHVVRNNRPGEDGENVSSAVPIHNMAIANVPSFPMVAVSDKTHCLNALFFVLKANKPIAVPRHKCGVSAQRQHNMSTLLAVHGQLGGAARLDEEQPK
ncbi:MAG: hypothetical protein CM15mP120_21360 [Pseudomonadota bacterium]|nr:MAG: hypothetical protein CM15mP120_21360 [Pseudomonadota bacterium]